LIECLIKIELVKNIEKTLENAVLRKYKNWKKSLKKEHDNRESDTIKQKLTKNRKRLWKLKKSFSLKGFTKQYEIQGIKKIGPKIFLKKQKRLLDRF